MKAQLRLVALDIPVARIRPLGGVGQGTLGHQFDLYPTVKVDKRSMGALSGEGISLEAHWDVAGDLAAGRLLEVMPDYRGEPAELYAVFAPGKPVPPRIRLFADHLAKMFARIQQGDRDGS